MTYFKPGPSHLWYNDPPKGYYQLYRAACDKGNSSLYGRSTDPKHVTCKNCKRTKRYKEANTIVG